MNLSEKQRKILLEFPASNYDALICDGAIRAGKTSIMSIAFILWAMANFNGCSFGICGKSVGSATRNIIDPLLNVKYFSQNGFHIRFNRSENKLTITKGNISNILYIFGGKDESSYMLIQGITLAGVLLDEVALMPRSFVEQALARCSVEGAKFWFNCNPDSPQHWFRKEWILQLEKHNAMHLHFLLDDNPSLSERKKQQYRTMYSGVFYQRYILGLWVMAEGRIYTMFDHSENVYKEAPLGLADLSTRFISCDYGTMNPTVFLDIYDTGEKIYIENEYRWDGRKECKQKTDEEYTEDFMKFMGERYCTVFVDPSAASFIAALRQRGVYVVEAKNNVLDGIRKMSTLIHTRQLLVNERCNGFLEEVESYMWDEKAAMHGDERPLKQNDHAMDACRYFVNSLSDWRFEPCQEEAK